MRSDSEIKRDIEEELRWDADIDPTDVGVTVNRGVVALSGFVRSWSQRWQAERDAKRVVGVVGLANDIQVRLASGAERSDPELARDVVSALRMQLPYTADSIQAVVANGRLVLEGALEWDYQRQRAEEAVRRIRGIKDVVNAIVVKPKLRAADVKHKIEEAFRRSAEIDATGVTVRTDGGDVILDGTVRTWSELAEAERAAAMAPGVKSVQNHLTIRP